MEASSRRPVLKDTAESLLIGIIENLEKLSGVLDTTEFWLTGVVYNAEL